jgi:hypothetical protein
MNLRNLLFGITACALMGAVAGCGKKSGTEPGTNAPASAEPTPPAATPVGAQPVPGQPVSQAEIDAMIFTRAYDRAAGLVARKDYPNALQALEVFKEYKLTAEQQAKVNALKAQIPGAQ